MINIADRIKISIDTVAFGGEGIGRMDDLVVFVPFTMEGDQCEIQITAVKKNFLRGRLEKIITPSSARTKPLCRHYQVCGGCQYQHIDYGHQIAAKERQLRETFARIGKLPAPDIRPMIPSPQAYHYRGKADFQIQRVKGVPEVGFISSSGDALAPIERCDIVDESINKKLTDFRRELLTGKIRSTTDRYTVWSDPAENAPSPGIDGLHPPRYIDRWVKGKRLQVPFNGFFQANSALLDILVETVEQMCGLTGTEKVMDGYCGSGLFSLFLAPHCAEVYGIDSAGAAIHCAKINSLNEGINNTRFYRGDISVMMDREFVQAGMPMDCIILDPPRSGCEKDVLAAVIALKPQKIIYISCNPATQARDLRYLTDRGIALKYVQPLDMFPQTQHIEAIALLERI
jgi:23S rRNA (uracil1939-C5)-methyltransferase